MARPGHMAGPRKPTQTPEWRLRGGATRGHMDACVAPTWHEEIFGMADDGPTS